MNAPPPVPAARLSDDAIARTPEARTPAAVTLSVADFGTSRSFTAPVLRPVLELLTSLIASAAGVTAVVGVAGPVPVAVMAAPDVPSAVKFVSTALMSPLPEATPMTTSPEVASAWTATAVGALPDPPGPGPGAGAAAVVLIFVKVVPFSEKYAPSEPAAIMRPVSQSTFRSLKVPLTNGPECVWLDPLNPVIL